VRRIVPHFASNFQANAGVLPEFQAPQAARESYFHQHQHPQPMTPQANAQGTCSEVHGPGKHPTEIKTTLPNDLD
jgi:hypothetical protein